MLLRFVLAILIGTTGGLLSVGAAHAHADLSFSTPEDGAELEKAPDEVRLTFNEELFAELVEVSVLDGDGNLVMATEAEQTPPPGTDVIVAWPTDLPPGEYSVAYRVVSEDGHPVTGQITFSYSAPPEPTAEPTAEQSLDPTTAQSPESTPSAEATNDDPSSATQAEPTPELIAEGEPDSSIIGPLLIGAAIIVGIGVVISIVMLARSRR